MPARSLQIGAQARLHILEAKDDYERYERLLQNPADVGWALVSQFYSAVHLVQAHAIAKCPTISPRSTLWRDIPKDHFERLKYISDHLGRIYFDYRRLQDASEGIRYDLWKPTREQVQEYHDIEFAKISEHLHNSGVSWL
jgi:hypothetical protein